MNDFTKTNKFSNTYWLKEAVDKLTFRIKIQSRSNTVTLPRLEDISYTSNKQKIVNNAQEYDFKWQAKVFSSFEIKKYSDIHNCSSEWDLNLHNRIKENAVGQKVYTYINEDCFLPLPVNKPLYDSGIINLTSCLENLKLGDFEAGDLYVSKENSMENDNWIAMHILYDNSKYDEEYNIIYRDQCLLLSLYYNSRENYIMMFPDMNNTSNPYTIESSSGELNLEYFVDIDFGLEGCSEELSDLLDKLHSKWEKKKKYVLPFILPPLGSKRVFITLEIAWATNFEMDNLYIEYHIKIPEGVQCSNDLTGRTHVTECLAADDNQWMFGHTIELEMDVSADDIDTPIKVFFEVISLDSWGRHRTEGYTYLTLSPRPGYFKQQLSCSRPEEINDIDAKSRRFFVGGCHLLEDLEVLEKPQLFITNYKTTSTGSLSVLWSTITQSHSPTNIMSIPSGSNVLQGADAVLKQYRQAKATLAAATKNFRETEEL